MKNKTLRKCSLLHYKYLEKPHQQWYTIEFQSSTFLRKLQSDFTPTSNKRVLSSEFSLRPKLSAVVGHPERGDSIMRRVDANELKYFLSPLLMNYKTFSIFCSVGR